MVRSRRLARVFFVLAFGGAGSGPAPANGGEVPQPRPRLVAVWPAGPLEVRIAADQPMDAETAGKFVGSSILMDQGSRNLQGWHEGPSRTASVPEVRLRVAAARLADGARTLILATDPHTREAVYTLPLPPGSFSNESGPGIRVTRGDDAPRLHYDLSGVEVTWSEGDGETSPRSSGWWPLLDPVESGRLTRQSVEHERIFERLRRPGRMSLATLVVLPPGRFNLTVSGPGPIEAAVGGEDFAPGGDGRLQSSMEATGEPIDLTLTFRTGIDGKSGPLRIGYRRGAESSETRPGRDVLVLPWAPTSPRTPAEPADPPYDLGGGDARRGEAIFFGDEARCSQCHKARGRGGEVGPDLGVVGGRGRLAVFREIADPGATIRPDYAAYTLALKDGRVVVGIVRAEGADSIRVTDTEARTLRISRAEIEEMRPTSTSIMPVGLVGALGEARIRDLLAFLTSAAGGIKPADRP